MDFQVDEYGHPSNELSASPGKMNYPDIASDVDWGSSHSQASNIDERIWQKITTLPQNSQEMKEQENLRAKLDKQRKKIRDLQEAQTKKLEKNKVFERLSDSSQNKDMLSKAKSISKTSKEKPSQLKVNEAPSKSNADDSKEVAEDGKSEEDSQYNVFDRMLRLTVDHSTTKCINLR